MVSNICDFICPKTTIFVQKTVDVGYLKEQSSASPIWTRTLPTWNVWDFPMGTP